MGYVLIGLLLAIGMGHEGQTTARLDVQMVKETVLAPEYVYSGVLDGKSYTLALQLKSWVGGHQLLWLAGLERVPLFSGFGIRNADHLAVISQDARTGVTTLIAYRIEPGTLNGRWTGGDGEVHTELCLVGKPA